MLYHVTLKVVTVMTLPIEAADRTEAQELALEMPVEEISEIVQIEELEVSKLVMDVSADGPVDLDDSDPAGFELYGERPVDAEDERYPGDQDEQY